MFNVKQRSVLVLAMLFSFVSAYPVVLASENVFELDGGQETGLAVKNSKTSHVPGMVSTINPDDLIDEIPAALSVSGLKNLLAQLSETPVAAADKQKEILAKLIPVFITCAQEHTLQALHDVSQQMAWLEYRKYHWFKSLFAQPTDIFYGSVEPRYNQLAAFRDRYLTALGRLTQLSDPSSHDMHDYPALNEMHEWVGMVAAAVNGLKDANATTPKKLNDYPAALQSLSAASDTLYAHDKAFCRRDEPLLPVSISSAAYWTGRTGVSLGMCAGGGFLISKYLANVNAADIVQVKENYKRAVRNFHTQFVIPGVTVEDIDRAAENLDARFLEDRVIPAVTHRVRTVNDWVPDLIKRATDMRRKWMPKRAEEILRNIPARTIAIATTLIWLADKTVVDILPWGIETMVGATAWMGTAAFIDRIVAVADALITAAGGVSVAPDMGMLLALVYKKKAKLAVLKYGGGAAGFLGLYALYTTIVKLNASKLSEHLTHHVHGMIATLAPYSNDTTGLNMQAIDLGKVMHAADEIKRELRRLESDKQQLFDNDIVALQSVTTSVSNRMQLLDSMYHTYSLVTIAL